MKKLILLLSLLSISSSHAFLKNNSIGSKIRKGKSLKQTGYNKSTIKREFLNSLDFISSIDALLECKISQNTSLIMTNNKAKNEIMGKAYAVGKVFKLFSSTFHKRFFFQFAGSSNCTTSKDIAQRKAKKYISVTNLQFSPGAMMSLYTIAEALDELGWKHNVEGLLLKSINANGSKIQSFNNRCDFQKKNGKLIYTVSFDAGNFKTNLTKEKVKKCLVQGN